MVVDPELSTAITTDTITRIIFHVARWNIHARRLYKTGTHAYYFQETATMHPHSPCVQQPAIHLLPITKHPPPFLARSSGSKVWSRPGHLALQLSGHSHRSRHSRAPAVSAPGARSLQGISNKDINQDAKLRFPPKKINPFLKSLGKTLDLLLANVSLCFCCCNTIRADKFFELEMSVRESELDQYGVVNHAVYCVYMEKG
jgi:hypothetical protein